jgi:hypothetical protein
LRLANQLDDLGKNRFGADALGLHFKRACLVQCATDDGISDLFHDRKRLACEHRFIDGASAGNELAIDWNPFAWKHFEAILRMNIGKRNHMFLAVMN